MARLLLRVAHRHLLDKGTNVVAFDGVGVVEVVAEIIFGEVERDEEARVVRGELWCAD